MNLDEILSSFKDPNNLNRVISCKYCGKQYTPCERTILGEKFFYHKPVCDCDLKQALEESTNYEEDTETERKRFENYTFLINYKNQDFKYFKKFDDIQLKTVDVLKKYQEEYLGGNKKSLYLYGSSGTGKTSLIKRLANSFSTKGIKVNMVDTQKLLSSYKNSYKHNDLAFHCSEYGIDSLVTSNTLLILDDVGTEKPSEWTISKLMYIFNERVENNRPTIITTNYSPNELMNRFGQAVGEVEAKRLVGRMIYNSVQVENTTKDYRFLRRL